jgi:hypothetical protein
MAAIQTKRMMAHSVVGIRLHILQTLAVLPGRVLAVALVAKTAPPTARRRAAVQETKLEPGMAL